MTGLNFLSRKSRIVAALKDEIENGNLDRMAAYRKNKKTL